MFGNTQYKWMSYTKATGWIEYNELQRYRREKKKTQNKVK